MSSKKYDKAHKAQIGLFGFGCAGQGLHAILNQTSTVNAAISKICVKDRHKPRSLPDQFFTFDQDSILDDPRIEIVVELIDDADAAFEITRCALKKGKSVVTANKRMLAERLPDIYELQLRHGRPILYEGAVCGSIPIVRNLEEYYNSEMISSIEGIFNGSTNFILTRIFDERMSYGEALSEAQRLGYAESNPALDISGCDARYKLVIAMAHAFGVIIPPEKVVAIGIDRISEIDLRFAREHDYTIKLIARAYCDNDKLFAFVAPQFVRNSQAMATVRDEFNAVQVNGAFAETQLFIGKGAGGYPTGAAVLSDITALTNGYAYPYHKFKQAPAVTFSNDLLVEVYIRFENPSKISISDFAEFKYGYAAQGKQYNVGCITLAKLEALAKDERIGIIFLPTPVSITRKQLQQLAVA